MLKQICEYCKKTGRVYFLLLMMVLVTVMTSCETQEVPVPENMVQVYYISNSETKVEIHEFERPSGPVEEQLKRMFGYLAATPEKLTYKAPLAMGFTVLNMDYFEGRLVLNVDGEYLKLAPTTEVLVRAALVRTLTQLESVDRVQITVEGNQLFDSAGDAVGWMGAEIFIHNDGSEINSYEQVRVKLYFASDSGESLIAAYREKFYSTNTPLERFVVEELIKGPSGKIAGLYPSINPETKILSVMTKDGICYVNLDSSFLNVVNNVSNEVAIYSIVNSLVELPHISKVQILINGEVPSAYGDSFFDRNLEVVTTLEQTAVESDEQH